MVNIQCFFITLGTLLLLALGGCTQQVPILKFDHEPTAESYDFLWSSPDDPYLKRLRTEYELDKIIAGSKSDYEKVQTICHWVHGLWEHHGDNTPKNDDPISILQEVKQGKRFRCVEYAIVISGCLNALGIPSRVLSLKTEDCETKNSGAGHVVAEAYLRDMNKWIMVDGQWDIIPLLDGTPLNAIELQNALAQKLPGLNISSLSGNKADEYFEWIAPYLFYFDIPLDNRVGVPDRSPKRLMLVPIGVKEPKVFQRKWPIRNTIYTHSARAFYVKPK